MKDDPFSRLTGLDQQLFQDKSTSKRSNPRKNNPTLSRANDGSSETSPVPTNERAKEPSTARSNERTSEPTRTRVSGPSGHAIELRPVERHSHDLFRDQVRWINRVKVDIEENYGRRVTGNQIVQLAMDEIRRDYEKRADESTLIRTLVTEQTKQPNPEPPSEMSEATG